MTPESEQQLLAVLRDLRDGQRQMIELVKAQHALAQEQLQRSRETITESVGLQKVALQRQKLITLFALPALVLCVIAIGYLVLRYL
jgi:hypothetical protein